MAKPRSGSPGPPAGPSLHRMIEGYGKVSTHPLEEVLRQWGSGELTPDQAVGHLMQHIAALHDQVARLRGRMAAVEERCPS
jgi:hypothetical protein